MNNTMLRIFIFCLLCATISLTSIGCGNKTKSDAAENNMSQPGAMDVDGLLADAENLKGKSVTVEGICTHICQHGGRKIFLMGSDDTKTIRVEGGEVGQFDAKCVNNVVTVTGRMSEERIDEAYLQQWEQEVADETAENHGETESGCSTEKQARNETGNSTTERIADFRKRIADREAEEGKPYLSFYYLEAEKYSVAE